MIVPLVIGPVTTADMATLAGCLAGCGIVLTRDSGDPDGNSYLIEQRRFVALATFCAGNLRVSILKDPECAWHSQIRPVICECLHANQHRKTKEAHA